MKKILSTAALAAFAALAFAAPASAGCMEEEQCMDMTTLSIGGLANFGGGFAATFEGDSGYAAGEKTGYGGVDITLSGAGDGCGPDCSDFSWTFDGYAGENVHSAADALTEQSGGMAAALNEGYAIGSISVSVGKIGESSQ